MATDTLVGLASLVLESNYFEFNDRFYRQKLGTAIGTKFAPAYANLFMTGLEERLLHLLKATTGGTGNTSLCSSEPVSNVWCFLAMFPKPLSAGWYVVTSGTLSALPSLVFLFPAFSRRVSLSSLRTLSIC